MSQKEFLPAVSSVRRFTVADGGFPAAHQDAFQQQDPHLKRAHMFKPLH